MPDLAAARQHIEAAAAQCVLAAQLADRHQAYELRRDGEVAGKKAGLAVADPHVKHALVAIEASLKAAAEAAKAHDFSAATAAQDSAIALMAEATLAKAHADKLRLRLPTLESRLNEAKAATPRAGAPDTKGELKRLSDEHAALKLALEAAPADMKALESRVAKAHAEAESLKARALLSDSAATRDQVQAQMRTLMQQSGGAALLDKLVKGMSRKDAPEHLLAALEVRFNLEAAADAGTGTDKAGMRELQRIYALMQDVPEKHVRNNPSLKKVSRKPKGGSAYGSGNMTLGDGPGTIALPRAVYKGTGAVPPNCLNNPNQLPDVLPDCRLDDTVEAPKFFDWNVQHEIAHALDDRKRFMASRAGNAEFGGWEDHGGDVLHVATLAAAEFALAGVDAEAIAKYLDSGTEPSPLPTDWAKVKTWADLTPAGKNPWDKGAQCNKSAKDGGLKLGERVYHQAYASRWVSYAAAARSQGITGYQFRAPGEWFSELYAAYKSKVLKSSHPAHGWLEKLFGNKAKAKA